MTYVDSCVVLDATANRDPRGERVRAAIHECGDESLVTSPLVDLECMVRPLRSGDDAVIARMRTALGQFASVRIADRAYELAAHMRAVHRLSTADSLHVATARLSGCDRLWTSDKVLLRALPDFAVDPSART